MDRRSFLRAVPATAGAVTLAGCSGSYPVYEITTVEGFENSDIFDSYEYDPSEDDFTVSITEAATVEHGVEEVEDLLYCGKDDGLADDDEFDMEPGQTDLVVMSGFSSCMDKYEVGRRLLVAYDSQGSPLDDVKLLFKKTNKTRTG